MQFWHRFSGGLTTMLSSSGTFFGITFFQLISYQFLGLALGLRLVRERFRLRLAQSANPAKARREQITGE